MDIWSALWLLMAWCVSARTSDATVLSMHTCVFSCLGVNPFVFEIRIVHENYDIKMTAVALCPCITKPPVAEVLT